MSNDDADRHNGLPWEETEARPVTMTAVEAAALAATADLLTEMWGAITDGRPITQADLQQRMLDAGLLIEQGDTMVLSPVLVMAVLGVCEALDRDGDGSDSDWADRAALKADDFGADVAAAEKAFADP